MELHGKTLAITGIGGFIGHRMCELAVERGMRVVGMDLDPDAVARATAAGAEGAFVGDVTDADAAGRLCEGADVIFHTAAVVFESGPIEHFRRVNVDGSRQLAEIARDSGVGRFVHLSSVMVYGFDYPPDVGEEGPYRGEGNPYCQTKIESEEAVLSVHEPGELEVVVIRPGDVYGPGSRPWVTRPLEVMATGLFMVPDGGRGVLNLIYVDDLLEGVFQALEHDATGEAFNLVPTEGVRVKDYFERLGALVGKPRVRSAPSALVIPVFSALEKVLGVVGVELPASSAAIRFLCRPHAYSGARARERFGFEPKIGLEEGMARVEEWLVERG